MTSRGSSSMWPSYRNAWGRLVTMFGKGVKKRWEIKRASTAPWTDPYCLHLWSKGSGRSLGGGWERQMCIATASKRLRRQDKWLGVDRDGSGEQSRLDCDRWVRVPDLNCHRYCDKYSWSYYVGVNLIPTLHYETLSDKFSENARNKEESAGYYYILLLTSN